MQYVDSFSCLAALMLSHSFRSRLLVVTIALLSWRATRALAQEPVSIRAPVARPLEPPIGQPVLGGAAFGAIGFIAGAWVGARSNQRCGGDECGLEEAFYGAAIGGTVGMALGVHVGNRRRGNVAADVLTGAAVWVAGMAIGRAAHWQGNSTLFVLTGIPIAQMITTVAIERWAGRQKDRAASAAVMVLPTSHGATFSVRFPLPAIR